MSEQWLEILDHTLLETNRVGLGIDMTLGGRMTEVPVMEADAAKKFEIAKEEGVRINAGLCQTMPSLNPPISLSK